MEEGRNGGQEGESGGEGSTAATETQLRRGTHRLPGGQRMVPTSGTLSLSPESPCLNTFHPARCLNATLRAAPTIPLHSSACFERQC